MTFFQGIRHSIKSHVVAEPTGAPEFNQDWTTRIDTVPGWLSRSEALLLWEMSSCVDPDHAIVEIGSYEGRSTVALASGSAGAKVIAIDPHTGDISQIEQGFTVDTWIRFQENITRCGVESLISAVRDTSVSAAKRYLGPQVELLFIDGWHSTDAVQADIQEWSQHLAPVASVVIDDWTSPAVAAGIINCEHLLPTMVGAVGKDLVFSNSSRVRSLASVRAAKRGAILSSPRRVMQRMIS